MTEVKQGRFLGPVLKRRAAATCQLLEFSHHTVRKARLSTKEAHLERNGGPWPVATLN